MNSEVYLIVSQRGGNAVYHVALAILPARKPIRIGLYGKNSVDGHCSYKSAQ